MNRWTLTETILRTWLVATAVTVLGLWLEIAPLLIVFNAMVVGLLVAAYGVGKGNPWR